MKKKRLISLLLAAFITVMPLSFSFAAPTPEPTADNTTSTVTSPDGTTRTVTSDGNDVKSTPKATESTDTSSDTETTSATETPSDTSSDTSSTSDTTSQSDTDTTSQNANSLPDGVTMEDPSLTPPNVQYAQSALLMDMASGRVLYSKNLDERVYPASTTKIMTAILALEMGNMDDTVTATYDALKSITLEDSHMGILTGEELTLDQLVKGMLVYSANDAANVIAEYISGSTDKFAELMNKEAQALGATQSHFVNPHGLPDDNHYTTAYDLYLIFNAAIKDDRFVNYISTKKYTTSYTDASGAQVDQVWVNTNGYLKGTYDMPENVTVIGGKTGTTEAAGSCLVLYSESQDKKPYISIVLKGNSKKELYTLMTELLTNYSN